MREGRIDSGDRVKEAGEWRKRRRKIMRNKDTGKERVEKVKQRERESERMNERGKRER